MKQFTTKFKAIDSTDGELKTWGGMRINARSFNEAEKICAEKYPYLTVVGEFVEEIDYNIAKDIMIKNEKLIFKILGLYWMN
jgi:hypothetical protein